MQSEEPRSYNYKFNGGADNVYLFSTKNYLEYDVRFKPGADYVPLNELWRDDFFVASIFFRHDNPYRLAIITAFERLATGEK